MSHTYFTLRAVIEQWLAAEEGQDMTEYALLLVLIVVASVGAVTALGVDIQTIMTNAGDALTP